VIRFDRVTKRYPPGVDALLDLSFRGCRARDAAGRRPFRRRQVHPAEADCRSGKVEFGGAVLVGGQNVGGLAPSALPYLRRRIGMVFQDQKLLFDRNAFENVMLPLSISGFPPREAAQRVRAALDKVGLGKREKGLPGHALRRGTATPGDRPRRGGPAEPAAGRRAHRTS
jgi:cell division transport system ATP-binding protein